MAEIRKYDPAAGNAIAQALKAAMGEPVRPNQPGSAPTSRTPGEPPTAPTTWVSLNLNAPPEPDED